MPLILQIGLLFLLFFSEWTVYAQAKNGEIRIQTTPSLDQVRPLSNPVRIALTVLDAERKTVRQGQLRVRLMSPLPGRLFSTDFPLVEGSHLIEMDLPISDGRAEWEYVFPIRGVYRLEVRATDKRWGEINRSFELRVAENRRKWFYLGSFVAALFVFGFMAGRLFTSRSPKVTMRMAISWLLLALNVLPSIAETSTRGNERSDLSARLELDPAVVGRPGQIRWSLTERSSGKPVPARLTLTITHLEKEKEIFSLSTIPTDGRFVLTFHFTDGAAHQVSSIAGLEGGESVRQEQVITVTGVEPPQGAIFPALFFFLAIVALGLVIGRASRSKKLTGLLESLDR